MLSFLRFFSLRSSDFDLRMYQIKELSSRHRQQKLRDKHDWEMRPLQAREYVCWGGEGNPSMFFPLCFLTAHRQLHPYRGSSRGEKNLKLLRKPISLDKEIRKMGLCCGECGRNPHFYFLSLPSLLHPKVYLVTQNCTTVWETTALREAYLPGRRSWEWKPLRAR